MTPGRDLADAMRHALLAEEHRDGIRFRRYWVNATVQATEHPSVTMTTGTTKETAMTSTNPLTPVQQRRAQAVKDARAAIVGGFGTVKDAIQVAIIAEYILNGAPEDPAAAEAKKAEEQKAARAERAVEWARATRRLSEPLPFYPWYVK